MTVATSAVGDGYCVNLDQVSRSGERFYPYYRVGWLVVAEQAQPGLFDHSQVLGPVVNDIDRDLGDLLRGSTGSGEGLAKVGEQLAGLSRQGQSAAVIVLGFLVSGEYRPASGGDDDMGIGAVCGARVRD